MNYHDKQQLLATISHLVGKGDLTVAELVSAGTQGLEQRFEKVNKLRVDAEFALMMVVDLVPQSKHAKHEVAMTKAKKVLVNSGAFEGTEKCKQLEAEIMSGQHAEKG